MTYPYSGGDILNASDLNDFTTGSIGVGTTSPDADIEVETDTGTTPTSPTEVRISTSTNGSSWSTTEPWGQLSFWSADTSNGGAKVQAAVATTANNSFGGLCRLSVWTHDATSLKERLTVTNAGMVGIATDAPDHVLELNQISGGEQDLLSCHNDDGAEGFRVAASVVRSSTIANTTTGSSANVFVSTASNTLFRSTVSALKYKTNVETMEDSYADAILGLRPVWYRSRCELDPESYGYWGFIAEEVAEVDPRIVTFGVPDDYEWQYDEDGEKIEPDVADLTEPEGVQYDRLVPHLVNLLARQRDQIADLEQRVAALEA